MSTIETQVMASVRVIHTARALLSAVALKVYLLAIAFIAIGASVSLPDVYANIVGAGVDGFVALALSALATTELLVQCLTVLVGISGLLLLRDIVRRTPALRLS